MNIKKILALVLSLCLVFGVVALAACGNDENGTTGASEEGKSTEAGSENASQGEPVNNGGSVYYLNFKPEADQAWQDLAKTYTEKTGVEVKVVTAASGEYDNTLTAEMDKSSAPTMFRK